MMDIAKARFRLRMEPGFVIYIWMGEKLSHVTGKAPVGKNIC